MLYVIGYHNNVLEILFLWQNMTNNYELILIYYNVIFLLYMDIQHIYAYISTCTTGRWPFTIHISNIEGDPCLRWPFKDLQYGDLCMCIPVMYDSSLAFFGYGPCCYTVNQLSWYKKGVS